MKNNITKPKILKRGNKTYILPGTIIIDGIEYYERNKWKDEAQYNLALSIIPKIAKRKKQIGADKWHLYSMELLYAQGNQLPEKELNKILEKKLGKKLYKKHHYFYQLYPNDYLPRYIINKQRDII